MSRFGPPNLASTPIPEFLGPRNLNTREEQLVGNRRRRRLSFGGFPSRMERAGERSGYIDTLTGEVRERAQGDRDPNAGGGDREGSGQGNDHDSQHTPDGDRESNHGGQTPPPDQIELLRIQLRRQADQFVRYRQAMLIEFNHLRGKVDEHDRAAQLQELGVGGRANARRRTTLVRGARAPPIDEDRPDESGIETPRRPPVVAGTIAGARGQGTSQIAMNIVQQTNLKPFDSLKGVDSRLFLDKYERFAKSCGWTDRQKVDALGQYVEGPAADWLSVLESDFRAEMTLDDEGVQSNKWYEIKWSQLRKLFEKEFAEEKSREILKRTQQPGETGLTYFYKMVKLHQQSGLDFDEKQLAMMITQHLREPYAGKFELKEYDSLDLLKKHLKLFDDKRAYELAAKSKEKRKATVSLLEEAEAHLEAKSREQSPETSSSGKNSSGSNLATLKEVCAQTNSLRELVEENGKDQVQGNSRQGEPYRNNWYQRRLQNAKNIHNGDDVFEKKPRRCYNCRGANHIARECWVPRDNKDAHGVQKHKAIEWPEKGNKKPKPNQESQGNGERQ